MADVLNINKEQEALKSFDRLEKRRLNGKFDFTITVGNQKIYADQNILASGSDYFDAMLSHDTQERQNRIVEMKGLDFESVKICIDHIYRREISVPAEKYQDVMVAATMMQLQVLCHALEEKISRNLTTNTFFPIQKLAIMFGKQELIDTCQQFAAENFKSISKKENFNTLEKSFIVELIKSESNEAGEKRKLNVILEWVRFDENRNCHLLGLLKCINFSQFPREIGLSLIKNEPLIKTSVECLMFFSAAIIESMASPCCKSRENMPTPKNQMVIFGQEQAKFSLFDPTESSFKELSWQGLGFRPYSVVNLGGHLYVLGEDKSVRRLKYSELGATWEQMPNMIKPHGSCPPSVVVRGCIYVIGGHDFCRTSAVERYNPQYNRWELLREAPKVIQYAGIVASGDHIYSFGGRVKGLYVNDVTRLDVKTLRWQKLSPMSEVKRNVAAAECGGFIYVAGGCAVGLLKTFERYDPSTDQWTLLSPMNIARTRHNSLRWNNVLNCFNPQRSLFNLHAAGKFLYAVSEYRCSPRSIEKYDIENDTWITLKKKAPFPIAYSIMI